MDEKERKRIILQDLKENGESSITDVSRRVGMANATSCKYLDKLLAEKKVTFEEVPPRKYYKFNDKT